MAKKAIADIGCPQMISIIEEAERYVAQHRDELRAAGSWEDFRKILGIGAMNDVLDNIAGRYLNASKELDAAKRRYMERHQDRFY